MTKSTLDPKTEKQLRDAMHALKAALNGARTSPKKARSSAANGALGGRPRKHAVA